MPLTDKTRMEIVGRFVHELVVNLTHQELGHVVRAHLQATSNMVNRVEEKATGSGRSEAYRHIIGLIADPKTYPDPDDVTACEKVCLEALSRAIPAKKPAPAAKKGGKRR